MSESEGWRGSEPALRWENTPIIPRFHSSQSKIEIEPSGSTIQSDGEAKRGGTVERKARAKATRLKLSLIYIYIYLKIEGRAHV